jgi:hypothetical protein
VFVDRHSLGPGPWIDQWARHSPRTPAPQQTFTDTAVEQVPVNALPVETVRTVLGRGDPIAPDYLSLLRARTTGLRRSRW